MHNTFRNFMATVFALTLSAGFNTYDVLAQDNEDNADNRKSELYRKVDQLEESHSREYATQYFVDSLQTGKHPWKDLYFVATRWQILSRDKKNAIVLYRAILQNTDKNTVDISFVNASLAEALVAEGKIDDAITFLEKTMVDSNGTSWERSALGQSYYAKEDYANALSHCVAAIIIKPMFPDPCWSIIETTRQNLPQSTSAYPANFKGKDGKTYPVQASQFVRHFVPKYWNADKLCNAAPDYRQVADRLNEIGAADLSQEVKHTYLARALDIAHDGLRNSDSKLIFKALSCVDKTIPFTQLQDPYRKSFHFLMSVAYLYSMNYRMSIDSVERLLASERKLLFTFDKDGKLVSHLVLKLLDLILKDTWMMISWDKETGNIRSKDMLDFSGYLFSIDADQSAVDRREVLRIVSKESDLDPEHQKGQGDKIFYMKPYGSVSSSEDEATLATCQKITFPDKKVEETPTPFFCGGPRAFRSFIKGGPAFQPSPDLDGAIEYALGLGDLELATKDLIMKIQDSFSVTDLNKKVFFDDMIERLNNIQQTKAKHNNTEYDRHTLVAIYIAEKSLAILKKMSL